MNEGLEILPANELLGYELLKVAVRNPKAVLEALHS